MSLFDLTFQVYRELTDAKDTEYGKVKKLDEINPRKLSTAVEELFDGFKFTTEETIAEHENACGYLSTSLEKDGFVSASLIDKLNIFAANLFYWSDRWSYSRFYTAKAYWDLIKKSYPQLMHE